MEAIQTASLKNNNCIYTNSSLNNITCIALLTTKLKREKIQ